MQEMIETSMLLELRKVLKRPNYPLLVMLVCARWYVASFSVELLPPVKNDAGARRLC
jgi:hypothetical protein